MDLAWTTQPPSCPGLYWWRDGRKVTPYLMLVHDGSEGLVVRMVETNRLSVTIWSDLKKSIDRPLAWFRSGEWAGPLGARREEQLIPSEDIDDPKESQPF